MSSRCCQLVATFLPNNSLERTGDAAPEARDHPDGGSSKWLRGCLPRPLSSQPLAGKHCDNLVDTFQGFRYNPRGHFLLKSGAHLAGANWTWDSQELRFTDFK